MSTTPAGWYPDPSDASKQRWWDGNQWTEHQQPAPGAYAAAPPAYGQQPVYGEAHGYGYGVAGGEPPKSHLAVAIISVLFVWPIAIYAIVKATQVSGLWTSGRYDDARTAAAAAQRWAWISIGIGIVIGALVIIGSLAGGNSTNY
jgi:hypothetical protein